MGIFNINDVFGFLSLEGMSVLTLVSSRESIYSPRIFYLISENFFQDIGKVALFQLMALFVIGSGGQAIKGIY